MKRIFILIVLQALLFITANLFAQYPVNNDGKSPFVQVVKDIRESVVNIKVEYEVEFGGASQFDDFFKYFFPDQNRVPQSKPKKRTSANMGSGFIFKQKGREVFIITNNHVAEKGKKGEITVTLADKAKYIAEIVGLDSETDLAVIKITVDKGEKITIAPLGDSDSLEIGDWAIAIGNPFGQLSLERTVTVGVISATGRANLHFGADSPIYQDYIQTDAAINPGNSGGPLLNIHGEVIGVNAAITSTSGGNVGIGFAIPVNITKKVVNDLVESGKVQRAYLGILPQEIDSDIQKSMKLEKVAGVLVAKVEKDTPAQKSGLKKGDVILKFNNKEVPNVAKFRLVVANTPIGQSVPMKVIRNKKEKTLYVKLITRSNDLASTDSNDQMIEEEEWLGINVEGLKGDFAKNNDINEDHGVVIMKISNDSPAEKSDLQIGDIILEINNHVVKNISSYQKFAKEAKSSKESIILFYVKSRNGNFRFVPVNVDN
ncbi:MAG: Do family serine endopeptidase [Candidatus Cloacimonetes bacterium]|nr:Do family serine endopeptidase [Candidatus Cloacimonadota bacterium]